MATVGFDFQDQSVRWRLSGLVVFRSGSGKKLSRHSCLMLGSVHLQRKLTNENGFTPNFISQCSLDSKSRDPVVETSSLSAVQPPEPTYDLKIMDELEDSKALSCLQIESIIYACQKHLHHLQNGTRAGFFIGDGASVGKGRTIAGLVWQNWQQGRQKALTKHLPAIINAL